MRVALRLLFVDTMTPFTFVVLALAIWRISNMLVSEDGPWLMFEHLRLRAGLQPPEFPDMARDTDPPGQMPGILFTCVWCMSVWIAGGWLLLYALSATVAFWLAMPFALSAVACIIDRWGNQ